jgi:hypothetical protein
MKIHRPPAGLMAVLALTFALGLGPGFIGTVRAASEDVAMFYDDLSQYGQWVEYENYGPVWRPNQVAEDWRPYTNGRWVPTNDGNVFESEEPWGWATYHYGNWMPTEGYGWVWVPGSTWYPSTVEWRSSPENEPVETSYIGWAPTPPPNYVPPPDYAPPSYYPGAPVTDSLASPLWIFAQAASFLLGFGQSYTPAYSYVTSGILVPPTYVPVFFSRTVFIPAYATPTYYPPTFIGPRRLGVGYYNMGPSVGYLSRVTRINQTVINQTINNNSIQITRIRNVVPPQAVVNRYGYVKQIIPPALAQGRPLPPPRRAQNFRLAQVNLNKPGFLPPPKGVPRINAQIPRIQPVVVTPSRGLAGTALPAKATMPLTPHMTQQIHQLPPKQQFLPGKSQPFKPVAATPPGPLHREPGIPAKPGQFQPGAQTKPERVQPGAPTHPAATPSGTVRRGEFHPGATRPGAPPAGTFTPPGAAKPSTAPLPQGYKGLTPELRRQQEQEHQRLQRGGTPGQSPQHQQEQRNQERQRQQQLQQLQQRQQQEHQRQLQQRHQQERQRQLQQQRPTQDLQRQQQRQLQQRELQQRQLQDGQRQQQQQIQRQQQQRQVQPRLQPQAPPRVQTPPPRPQPQAAPRPQPQPQPRQQQNRPDRTKRENQQ